MIYGFNETGSARQSEALHVPNTTRTRIVKAFAPDSHAYRHRVTSHHVIRPMG